MNVRFGLRGRHLIIAVVALCVFVLARSVSSPGVAGGGGASSFSVAPDSGAFDVNEVLARRLQSPPPSRPPGNRYGFVSSTFASKGTPTPTAVSPTRTSTPSAAGGLVSAITITPTATATAAVAIPPGETVVPIAPTPTAATAWTPTNTPALNATATATPPTGAPPQLIFGLGPTADTARSSSLAQQATLGMYTTWYNGPNDLNWMTFWKNSLVPQVYATGRAMHLVVFSGDAETGTPCGRQYPISAQINGDMVQLAQIFGGNASGPPLYVTLFTEFQTYPCIDNQWSGAEAYHTQLQTKMIQIRDIFHQNAPNSKVSIGWGGWQTRWDDAATGGGRSLFAHFDATMRAMDFQSFQAMQSDTNVNDVRQMTRTLGAYGPVMLAHHKPDGFHPTVFDADVTSMMTDTFLSEMTGYGLFAWSFMDQKEIASSAAIFNHVRDAVLRYGRTP